MPYKTLNFPIRVPKGDYCWKDEICSYFDNYSGVPNCLLRIGELKYEYNKSSFVKKPQECINLKKV